MLNGELETGNSLGGTSKVLPDSLRMFEAVLLLAPRLLNLVWGFAGHLLHDAIEGCFGIKS